LLGDTPAPAEWFGSAGHLANVPQGQTEFSKAALRRQVRRGYGTALPAGGVGSSRSIRSNNFPSPADSSANQTRA